MSSDFEAFYSRVPLWKCGEPLKYTPPKEDTNLWDTLLNPLLERDKEQCEVWKAEVENLLIFAGLFSAVITTFIVESYKALQSDPAEETIKILLRIAANLETFQQNQNSLPEKSVSTLPPTDSFIPSSADSRLNILWFISLVLSLTAALIGTVSLQWLREHQRYPVQTSSRDKFAMFNMRRDGLRDWYVPHILLLPPMLLQIALVLFLIGLVDFLQVNTPNTVYVPIIAVIALPIVFLFITTVIPPLQWLPAHSIIFPIFRRIPSQCPYKSPQVSVLGSILIPTITFVWEAIPFAFSWGLRGLLPFRNLKRHWKYRSRTAHLHYQSSHTPDEVALYYREHSHQELYKHKLIGQRGSDNMKTLHALFPLKHLGYSRSLPIYDWIAGLKAVGAELRQQPSVRTAQFHCMREISAIEETLFNTDEGWHQYIQNILDPDWPNCRIRASLVHIASKDSSSHPKVALEETCISISRDLCQSFGIGSVSQLHEFYIRTTNHYITKPLQPLNIEMDTNSNGIEISTWGVSWRVLHGKADRESIISEFSQQYTMSLDMLFSASAVQTTEMDADPLRIFRLYAHAIQFVKIACRYQNANGRLSTLRLISNQAQRHLLSKEHVEVPQYLLFYLMACYIGWKIELDSPILHEAALKLCHFRDTMGDCLRANQDTYDFAPYEQFSKYYNNYCKDRHTISDAMSLEGVTEDDRT